MASGSSKRHRSELALPPGQLARTLGQLRRRDVMTRIGLCLLAAFLMWLATGGWSPPFAYREGDVPARGIVARTQFQIEDPEQTRARKEEKRQETICVYQHDVQPLIKLRRSLKDQVFQVIRAESYAKLDREIWQTFLTEGDSRDPAEVERAFVRFREAFADDPELVQFAQIVKRAFEQFESTGVLRESELHSPGSQLTIMVHPVGDEHLLQEVEVKDVRAKEATATLRQRLTQEFQLAMVSDDRAATVAHHVLAWLDHHPLPTTLALNREATERAYARQEANVETVMRTYKPGDKLVQGGQRLTAAQVNLLRCEHRQLAANMSWSHRLGHGLAEFGMYVALYVLCGFFVYYRQPKLLLDMRRFATMLALVVAAVALSRLVYRDQWRAEIMPLLVFGMTVTIAYRQDVALLLSASVALIVALSLGQGLVEFVIFVATAATAIQLLDRVRSRTKLIYVGLGAGVVAALTTLGASTVGSQVFGAEIAYWVPKLEPARRFFDVAAWALLSNALWYGFCALLAGVLMSGLLPFIEKMFDVQTDLSLLEMGDAAHPLLQELVRRAPGTYNHSINVASIAEAAAEAIGANGLLVRVGAYFHDIGKMLKPSYFVENQGQNANRHESLGPAMSTLVIIAHVKDGADLARQHRLPQSIIDFIQQHHGTTLVEYFYDQATRQNAANPDSSEIDETTFRYPGPKPQTKEAGVMMLADAAEGASRTLVEPTPARIESLVHDILMNRLLNGQFDECGLTLRELHVVEESLVKSLTAVYHGRVKYPEKQHSA